MTIRATFNDRRLELIPNQIFQGDLPDYFVQEFVHWLDLGTNVVEFRPLLDSILRHLETTNHILVFVDNTHSVQIELRRYGLKFCINRRGELIATDYDAIVDGNQDAGCLYGLHNKLILRSHNAQGPPQRHVLIPYGPVAVAKNAAHVSVSIDLQIGSQVKYFRYRCDEYLKVIQTPTDRLSNLFLAYLRIDRLYLAGSMDRADRNAESIADHALTNAEIHRTAGKRRDVGTRHNRLFEPESTIQARS